MGIQVKGVKLECVFQLRNCFRTSYLAMLAASRERSLILSKSHSIMVMLREETEEKAETGTKSN